MRPRAARRAAGGSKGCSPTPGPPKGGGGAAGSRGVQGVSPCAALPPGDEGRRSPGGLHIGAWATSGSEYATCGDAVRVEQTEEGAGDASPGSPQGCGR